MFKISWRCKESINIQVACPRISTDNEFDKPMLSTPQANALLKMLKNEKLDNYLEIPHWL